MPATKKKAAPAVKADSAVGKATLKPVKVAKVPVVQATSKGKGMQRFKYTGKKASSVLKLLDSLSGLHKRWKRTWVSNIKISTVVLLPWPSLWTMRFLKVTLK